MTQSYVGLPTDGAGCAYSADLDEPACGGRPTVHVAVNSAAWGLVALASCMPHAPSARASGDPIAEHPYGPRCDEGTCWPEGVR